MIVEQFKQIAGLTDLSQMSQLTQLFGTHKPLIKVCEESQVVQLVEDVHTGQF